MAGGKLKKVKHFPGGGNSVWKAGEGILYISLSGVKKGRQRKDDGKPCVTSVAIMMFEKNFCPASPSSEQIFR